MASFGDYGAGAVNSDSKCSQAISIDHPSGETNTVAAEMFRSWQRVAAPRTLPDHEGISRLASPPKEVTTARSTTTAVATAAQGRPADERPRESARTIAALEISSAG